MNSRSPFIPGKTGDRANFKDFLHDRNDQTSDIADAVCGVV